MKNESEEIKKMKDDSKEIIAVIEKIPKERKAEALGIVRGFALGAAEAVKKQGGEECETKKNNWRDTDFTATIYNDNWFSPFSA